MCDALSDLTMCDDPASDENICDAASDVKMSEVASDVMMSEVASDVKMSDVASDVKMCDALSDHSSFCRQDGTLFQHTVSDASRPGDHANPCGLSINSRGDVSHTSRYVLYSVIIGPSKCALAINRTPQYTRGSFHFWVMNGPSPLTLLFTFT